MLEGLVVDAARMRRNLDMTRGLIVAEAVMMGLAPHLGRQKAHDVVYAACRTALEAEQVAVRCARRRPGVPVAALPTDRLRALCDPANYLGAAPAMVDAIVRQPRGS